MSKYSGFDIEGLENKVAEFSDYQKIVNHDPFPWTLEDAEVEDKKTRLTKKIKIIRLTALYFFLDAIYHTYDIMTLESRLVANKAMLVTVRLTTTDKDGVVRVRDGHGSAEAAEGLRNVTAMAEALAIKNAAKKLGRLFGRDLYSEDELPIVRAAALDEDSVDESEELDEDINPVFEAICKQLVMLKDVADLAAIVRNISEKSDADELDSVEYLFLTEMVEKKRIELTKKGGNGKAKTVKNRQKNTVPVSLPRGVVDKKQGGNKRG